MVSSDSLPGVRGRARVAVMYSYESLPDELDFFFARKDFAARVNARVTLCLPAVLWWSGVACGNVDVSMGSGSNASFSISSSMSSS